MRINSDLILVGGSLLATLTMVNAQAAPLAGAATPAPNLAATSEPEVFAYQKPAQGFDPLAASEEELMSNGFPPRPDVARAPEAYKRWQKMVTAPQSRVEHPQLQRSNVENRPVADLKAAANQPPAGKNTYSTTSGNWSGYAIYAPADPFTSNYAFTFTEFVVPQVQQAFGACNGTWDYSSLWTGFDGFGSGDVLQAGIEADAYCSSSIFGTTRSTFYSPWYEWYPNGSVRISSVAANPGNLMAVEVWYTTSAPNGHAYIINYDTQQSVSLAFNIPGGTSYLGNSVEWVVEAPSVGGSLATLSNYIAAPFNYSYAYGSGNYYYPSSSPAGSSIYSITMEPGTTPLSYCLLYGTYTLWCQDEGTAY